MKHNLWMSGLVSASVLMILVGGVAARGQAPQGGNPISPAAPQDNVEYWTGRITRHETIVASTQPGCTATIDRFFHVDYDLQVDPTGKVTGMVKGAADFFALHNCDGWFSIPDPIGNFQVTGHRYTDASGHPAFVFDSIIPLHLGYYLAIGCYYDQSMGRESCLTPIPYPLTIRDFLILDDEYIIHLAANGQQPRACLAAPDVNLGYFIMTRNGCLEFSGSEPSLSLNSELGPGVFLNQVSVSDQFDALVNWKALDGGHLLWQLGQATPTPDPTSGNTVQSEFIKTLDVGTDVGVGQTLLSAQAISALGLISNPQVWPIQVAPPPPWAGPVSSIIPTKQGGAVNYQWDQSVPQPPFSLSAVVPDSVPLIGGYPFTFLQVQVPTHFQVWSQGSGISQGQNTSGLEIMNGLAHGRANATGRLSLTQAGVNVTDGHLTITANDNLDVKEPLLRLVPPLAGVLNFLASVWPGGANVIDSITTIHLPVGIDLTAPFRYTNSGSKLVLEPDDVTVKLPLRIPPASLTLGPLSIEVGVGGDIHMTIKAPQLYFTDLGATLAAWAKATLFHFGACVGVGWSWTFPGAPTDAPTGCGAAGAQAWRLLDRSYLTAPDYARWIAPAARVSAANSAPVDTPLVANIFPQAQPSLAVSPANRLLVWSHDKPNSPALSGQEIAYSSSCNSCQATWAPWQQATNDNLADFAPHAAFVNDTTALAVWERFDTSTPPDINTDPAGYLGHVQIAAAKWNAITGIWSAPQQLSTGSSFNSRPQLAPTSSGALAVWVGNAADHLIGDATHPDQILFSRYISSTASWSAPSSAVANLAGLVDFSLATNGDHAALVYALDTDGVLSTTNDIELFYTQWVTNSWSAPVRLTSNSAPDDDPQLALDSNGNPLLVWLQNGALKFLSGSWDAVPVDLPLSGSVPTGDMHLARSSIGNLALTWRTTTDTDTRIAYAIYDGSTGAWSDVHTLQPPAVTGALPGATPSVVSLSPAFGRDDGSDPTVKDTLLIGYQLATVDVVTATIGGVTVTNVPSESVHSLHFMDVPLGVNLGIAPSDLSASLSAGHTHLAAVIHNSGDLSVSGAPIVLHVLLNSQTGSVPTETQRITQTLGTLNAGQSVTVTFPVTPSALGNHIYTVEIDPAHTLNETRVDDNVATLGSALALHSLSNTYTPDGVIIHATVNQSSTIYNSLGVTASLNLTSPDGQQLDSIGVGFPITPTPDITVGTWISAGQLGYGWHLVYWNLDASNSMGQADRSGNVAPIAVPVLPDLTTDAAQIGFGRAPGLNAPFNTQILNIGNWSSHGGRLAVYDSAPNITGTHTLLSLPLPDIAAGSYAELSGTLDLNGLPAASTGLSAIYVQIDPDNLLDEIDENNNLAAAGGILGEPVQHDKYRVYLPIAIK